jgi:hypothetical protein
VDEFGWNYDYADNTGLVIDADNSFFTYDPWNGGNMATYIRDGLKVLIDFRPEFNDNRPDGYTGMWIGSGQMVNNLFISQNGKVTRIGIPDEDYYIFGVGHGDKPYLSVQGDWIYTTLLEEKQVNVRVNVNTYEIQVVNDN